LTRRCGVDCPRRGALQASPAALHRPAISGILVDQVDSGTASITGAGTMVICAPLRICCPLPVPGALCPASKSRLDAPQPDLLIDSLCIFVAVFVAVVSTAGRDIVSNHFHNSTIASSKRIAFGFRAEVELLSGWVKSAMLSLKGSHAKLWYCMLNRCQLL
jgi:hypothetical protein